MHSNPMLGGPYANLARPFLNRGWSVIAANYGVASVEGSWMIRPAFSSATGHETHPLTCMWSRPEPAGRPAVLHRELPLRAGAAAPFQGRGSGSSVPAWPRSTAAGDSSPCSGP